MVLIMLFVGPKATNSERSSKAFEKKKNTVRRKGRVENVRYMKTKQKVRKVCIILKITKNRKKNVRYKKG